MLKRLETQKSEDLQFRRFDTDIGKSEDGYSYNLAKYEIDGFGVIVNKIDITFPLPMSHSPLKYIVILFGLTQGLRLTPLLSLKSQEDVRQFATKNQLKF